MPWKPGDPPASGSKPWQPGDPAKKKAGSKASAPAPAESSSFLSRALKDAKNTVTNVPRGIVGLGKDAATELAGITKSALVPGYVARQEAARKKLTGAEKAEFDRKHAPISFGWLDSNKNTTGRLGSLTALLPGGQAAGDSRIVKDYSARPVSSLVEDAANIAPFLKAIGGGAGQVAERTASPTAGRVASAANKAATVTEKVAAAPVKPFEVAGKIGGKAGRAVYEAAAGSEGRVGELMRTARLDPASRQARQALMEGHEQASEAVGQQVSLGQRLERMLPKKDEQAAYFIVGEGEASALAKLRDKLPAADFERFVTERYGDTVSPKAVHLAADVAEGSAPELQARIDEALKVGREAPGGRADRLEAYLGDGKSSREFQTGYDADPIALHEATEKAMKPLPKAQREATRLRAKADEAHARLVEADADITATGEQRAEAQSTRVADRERSSLARQAERAAARAAEAADRLTALQDLAEAAKVPAPASRAEQAAADRLAKAGGARALANHEMVSGEARVLPSFARIGQAEDKAATAAGRLAEAARRNGGVERGQAAERAAQAERLTRMETRRARSLTSKAERVTERDMAVRPLFGEGKRLGSLETRARVLENTAKSAEARVGKLRANVTRATAKTAMSVDAAPARLRPLLSMNRAAVKELERHAEVLRAAGDHEAAELVGKAAQELPVTRQRLKADGVDVDHFIHIRVGDKPIGGGGQEVVLPKVRKTRAEKHRAGSAAYDRTFRAQAQAEIDELRGGIAKETAKKIETLPFARKFATPAEAAEAGYVAWDPKNIFEKNPNPKPGATYIPQHVFDSFRSYFTSGAVDKAFAATYDRALRAWKVSVLPLSPSWQVGNIVGNATLATLGAGVGPVRLAQAMGEAISEYRKSGPRGERQLPGPRRLYTSGATHAEFDFLRGVGESTATTRLGRAAERVRHPASAVIHGSYALNGFVDDFGRSAVFIAKKGEGLSEEAALRESLKAMGDFSRMTPLERKVIKRVVPFYAWQRHMTQLAFRLPVEHPMRVAWTLHIGDQWGQPDDELAGLPDFQRGAIPLPGGRLLGTNSFFPFGDAGKILTPEGLRQSLSPLIKVPAEHFSGLNFFTGRPFTRPPGSGKPDDFGRELPTPPPLSKHLTDQIAQKRLIDALSGRSDVVRYDSGDKVITNEGPIPSDKTKGQAVLRYLGLPISDRKAAEEEAKRIEESKAKLRKASENYRRRLEAQDQRRS